MPTKSKAPLIFGTVILILLAGFLAFYKSSPGDLNLAHQKATGIAMITNCRKCHTTQGLVQGCLKCHKEIQAQLSSNKGYHAFLLKGKKVECASCHQDHNGKEFQMVNKKSWGGKEEKDFVHQHVNYTLTDKHLTLACDKCHAENLKAPFVLKDFPEQPRPKTRLGLTQVCVDCHKDPHANGLSPACEKCHRQDTFKNTKPLFDHDKFYPLIKGHSGVACTKCHIIPADRSKFSKDQWAPFDKVKGKSCASCHENPHLTDWKRSCETCHHVDARPWNDASRKFTKKDHALTGFPLVAPHSTVKCAECHQPNLKYEKKYPDPRKKGYDRGPKSCEGCHEDKHQGQFISKYPRCLQCHSELKFKPNLFGVKEHQKTKYPLTGKHITTQCNACHNQFKAKGVRLFIGTPTDCASCHKDIHKKQFDNNGKTTCEKCHQSTASWKKLVFDHNRDSKFKLDDAHINVACNLCHIPIKLKNEGIYVPYKPLKSECSDCHKF